MILNNISVDCVIFGFDERRLNVLLWQADQDFLLSILQEKEKYKQIRILYEKNPAMVSENYWGLIGAHAPAEQDIDAFAKNILATVTGLNNVYLKQFHTFGSTSRVPYYRVVTVAFYVLINPAIQKIRKQNLARSLKWFPIHELPDLIFDHEEIIRFALLQLKEEVKYHPVGFHLLPDKFTLSDLQNLYEAILETKLDTRNFRKKILKMGLLIDTSEKQKNVAHRAAKYYSFDPLTYQRLVNEGLNFRI